MKNHTKGILERIRTPTELGFVAGHILARIKIQMAPGSAAELTPEPTKTQTVLGSVAGHILALTKIPMVGGFAVASTQELIRTQMALGLSVEHTRALIKIQTGNGCAPSSSNMALNLAPFGRWTLRNKAAQRRLVLR